MKSHFRWCIACQFFKFPLICQQNMCPSVTYCIARPSVSTDRMPTATVMVPHELRWDKVLCYIVNFIIQMLQMDVLSSLMHAYSVILIAQAISSLVWKWSRIVPGRGPQTRTALSARHLTCAARSTTVTATAAWPPPAPEAPHAWQSPVQPAWPGRCEHATNQPA